MKGAIFTYVLTLVGAVGGLFNPFFGLLIYVSFSIVKPEAMWNHSLGAGGRYSLIVGISMLIGWTVARFGRWNLGRAGTVVLMLLGYWVWSIVSMLQARDADKAGEFVFFLIKIVLPFLVGITMIRTVQQLKQLAWTITLSLGYLAFEFNLSYLGGYNSVWLDGFCGLDNNGIAIAMVTGVGLAFFLGLGTKRWTLRAAAFFSAALMVHVIMFSFSRGGLVALCLTGFVSFLMIPKRAEHYLAFAGAVVLGFFMAGKEVRERFLTVFVTSKEEREVSAQSRLDLWRDGFDAALKNPVLGLGPDCWGGVAGEYGWGEKREVHSLWVQTAAEIGFIGAGFLVAFYGLTILWLWPLARGKGVPLDPWMQDAARMVIAALVGFAVSAQFVSLKALEVPFYVTLVGAGLLALVHAGVGVRGSGGPADPEGPDPPRKWYGYSRYPQVRRARRKLARQAA